MHYRIINGEELTREPCDCPIGQDHLVESEGTGGIQDVAAEPSDRITGLAPADLG